MTEAVKILDFETAAILRDEIEALKYRLKKNRNKFSKKSRVQKVKIYAKISHI